MKYFILKQYNLILIRYGEVWLKSQKVKIRMLNYLMTNIKNMLARNEIPFHKYQLSKDSSRIFFFFANEQLSNAMEIMQRTFGVHSFSPALRTSNKIENIIERTLEVAQEVLVQNDTFALRVKRSGTHDYSSLDVAKIVGKEIIEQFPNLNLKVNLSSPQKKIFIEIRNDFSYIFTHIYETEWGGLPIEPQKKILVMDVGRLEDLIAGFLLMRRGSKIYPLLFDMNNDTDKFKTRLSNWKEVVDYIPFNDFKVFKVNFTKLFDKIISKLGKKEYICAICRLIRFQLIPLVIMSTEEKELKKIRAISDGLSFNNASLCYDDIDLNSISLNYLFSNYPIFTPVISFSSNKISSIIEKISKNLIKLDYCKYKPQDQKFEKELVQLEFEKLNPKEIIKDIATFTEEVNLSS